MQLSFNIFNTSRERQIQSLLACVDAGVLKKQNERVFGFLKHSGKSWTSRQISEKLEMERTSVTRTIKALVDLGLVDDSSEAFDWKTGRHVTEYKAK